MGLSDVFTSSHGQGGEGVLEDLLEAQELDDGEGHRGVQPAKQLMSRRIWVCCSNSSLGCEAHKLA